MKTSPVTFGDLERSPIAVPPLARFADHAFDRGANERLVRHIESGGIATLLYGGNANLYHVSIGEYATLLGLLAEIAGPATWVIPSVGPDFGKMRDQVRILREHAFPTVMVLPHGFPHTPAGVATAHRKAAELLGRPVVVYLKAEDYIAVDEVRRLVDDGLVSAVKYAIVRRDPADDVTLRALLDAVDPRYVVSGMGERPVITHFRLFGLRAFTSGSGCLAPRLAVQLQGALRRGDEREAEALRSLFMPLEDHRDRLSPIRVLHEAVGLAGIADMGPPLPLLAPLEPEETPAIAAAARALAAADRAA